MAADDVLVGLPLAGALEAGVLAGPLVAGVLAAGLEAGLVLGFGRAVADAEVVADGGDEGAELRVAVMLEPMLEPMLFTADDRLPAELHAAHSKTTTTIRPANPADVFLTAPACAVGAWQSATPVG